MISARFFGQVFNFVKKAHNRSYNFPLLSSSATSPRGCVCWPWARSDLSGCPFACAEGTSHQQATHPGCQQIHFHLHRHTPASDVFHASPASSTSAFLFSLVPFQSGYPLRTPTMAMNRPQRCAPATSTTRSTVPTSPHPHPPRHLPLPSRTSSLTPSIAQGSRPL